MKLDTFFRELQRLINTYPLIPSHIVNSEDCNYGDKVYYSKNLYYCFDCANCSDGTYLHDSYLSPNCVDCDYSVETELCYECVDAFKCFNSAYLDYCASTQDSMYSYNCLNCHDIFGCAYLQNKSYCIFNRQLTEEEYKEKLRLYKKLPKEKLFEILEQIKLKYPLTQTNEAHNENSQYGDYVFYSKNCYLCFDAGHNEDCCYMYDSFYNKNCYDGTYASQQNQLTYEAVDCANLFNCNYAVLSTNCNDSSYIFNCSNVKNSLGCVSLSNKQFCILNRQLNKEVYEDIQNKLFAQLKEKNIAWNTISFTR